MRKKRVIKKAEGPEGPSACNVISDITRHPEVTTTSQW
jgi:hypothetical protein